MAQRIEIDRFGGPEVLAWREVDVGAPGPDELRVRHRAVGLNYIDVYHRTGLYPLDLPTGLGLEAAGVVTAVGAGVEDYREGDRVGYCWGPPGAYATERLIAADMVVPLPDGIDDRTAAAVLLKGCTAEYLIRRTCPVKAGDTVLFHAAAGGVGLIACQWLAALGATVIGAVGSPEKAALARANGTAHTIDYRAEDIAARVRDLTDGAGVAYVFDGVGAATFDASLDSLRPRGTLASFGNASGPVASFNLGLLAQKGSLYVTRPTLFHYYATPKARRAGVAALFEAIASGAVKVHINQTFPLEQAARAQQTLEARRTTGSTILLP